VDARIGDALQRRDDPYADGEERLPRPATGRFAAAGLTLVLLLLTSFGLWASFTTDRAAHRLQLSSQLNEGYESAQFAVTVEESLERKYRLEPGPDVRALFDQASASLQAALVAVRSEGGPSDRAFVDRVLSLHTQYLGAIGRMFDAVDVQDPVRVLAIDGASVDPLFSNIEHLIDARASELQRETFQRLSSLNHSSALILIATPITFAMGLALLGVFFSLLIGYRRRIEEARTRELSRQAREQQRLLQGTLRSAEEERIRIAADLHDGPIQHLTALDYRLEAVANRVANGQTELTGEPLRQAQEWLRQDISELRNMMAELRLPVVDQRGLAIALESYTDALTRDSALEYAIDCRIDGNLDPTTETVLYRVAQEALRNIVKHAHAHHAEVLLDRRNGSILLEVRDDGDGFEPMAARQLTDQGHFGLVGMRERVEMAGGTLEVESARGAGTLVSVALPNRGASL
jgi:signal transduction histidine kinase